jgi:membrane protease YdiL (CAAX protease family)
MKEKKKASLDMFKLSVCIIALCIIMGLMLGVYNSVVPTKIAELEEKGKMDNVIWVIRYGSVVLPVIVVAIILMFFYFDKSQYVPVNTQREKAYICLFVALFTFFIMLPYVIAMSGGFVIEKTVQNELGDDETVKTLLGNTATWFAAQIIPFAIIISYHFVRVSSEKKELLANER